MELREKLKEALDYERYALECPNGTEDAIDRILAIPEIAEALEYTERMSKHLAGMIAEDISKLPLKVHRDGA